MKKILDYFSIEGAVGGNQEWFKNVVMYIGGCAAATACDCCIYLALRRGMTHLYPYDVHALTKQDYIDFSMKMKPYLRPRVNGVNKLWMFTEGFGKYLKDIGEDGLKMKELSGTEELRTAECFIRDQIDSGYPVPYLMLRHRKTYYKDFVWHWFCATAMRNGMTDCGLRSRHTASHIHFSSKICGIQAMRRKAV